MHTLFLSAALLVLAAPPVPNVPSTPHTLPPGFVFYSGSPWWTRVEVRTLNADVPANLVDATIQAMSAGVARPRLLLLLSQNAAAQGRSFVVVGGVGCECEPTSQPTTAAVLMRRGIAHDTVAVPVQNFPRPLGVTRDDRVNYQLGQHLEMESHLNTNGTAVVDLSLTESVQALSGSPSVSLGGWQGETFSGNFTFHDGQTLMLRNIPRADGVHHLIFAVVYVVPPNGHTHPSASSMLTKP